MEKKERLNFVYSKFSKIDSGRNFFGGFFLFLISLIALLRRNGFVGMIIGYIPAMLFGSFYLGLILILLARSLYLLFKPKDFKVNYKVSKLIVLGLVLSLLMLGSNNDYTLATLTKSYFTSFKQLSDYSVFAVLDIKLKGGLIGNLLFSLFNDILGKTLTLLIAYLGVGGFGYFTLRPLVFAFGESFLSINQNKRVNKAKAEDYSEEYDEISYEEHFESISVKDHSSRSSHLASQYFAKPQEIIPQNKNPFTHSAPSFLGEPLNQKKSVTFNIFTDSFGFEEKQQKPPQKEDSSIFIDLDLPKKSEMHSSEFRQTYNKPRQETYKTPTIETKSLFKSEESYIAPTEKIQQKLPIDDEASFVQAPITAFEPDFGEKQEGLTFAQEKTIQESEEPVIKVRQINENTVTRQVPRTTTHQESKKEYILPPIDLLKQDSINRSASALVEANAKAEQLEEKLKTLNIDAWVNRFTVAPAFTRFELEIGKNVKMNQFAGINNDLMAALSAQKVNILAPIPGSQFVGIDIPNKERSVVSFKEVLQEIPYEQRNKKLLVILGKDITGKVVTTELEKAPHMLIAGQTGSGKSVCINSILLSLIMRATPDEVKLILIDPKRVELAAYDSLPHLLCPVITDPQKATIALARLAEEVQERFELLVDSGFKNVEAYNNWAKENNEETLPFIVLIIDELANLMAVTGKSVEANINAIASLARAAGIHLITATQRPSVDVVTGLIKANIPTRIAFAVASGVDSRTILDAYGAEQLLGMGDMLFSHPSFHNVERVQGAFVNDDDVEAVVAFIKKQAKPKYDAKFLNLEPIQEQLNLSDSLASSKEADDSIYYELVRQLITNETISTTSIQRVYSVGYQRASRLIDRLEEDGLIGPAFATKPREVYKDKVERFIRQNES